MTEVKKTYEDLLNETVEHYNLSNRGVNEATARCCYLTDDGKPCAIGRILKEPEKFREYNYSIDVLIDKGYLDPARDFKEEYASLNDVGLLHSIQYLHDADFNWTKRGISEQGLDKVKYIRQQIRSNTP
jgi:hypothetical protein